MRYTFSLLLCLFVKIAFGQNSSLLWEISGKGLKKPSYLYGTMHVKDERVFRFGDSVMIKFNSCKVYAGELAMDQISPGDALSMMLMPKDTTLKMLLSKEDYDFVKKKVEEKMGPMAMMVDRIKPLFSSVLVTEMSSNGSAKDITKDSTLSLDVYLQNQAKKKGMKVIGIETPEEQIAAIDKLSLKVQAQMLVSTLKDSLKTNDVMEDMYEMYLNQDLAGMERLMHHSEMPDLFSDAILTKRNYVMADRISKVIKKNPTFIGIGAAHLAGEEGVIALLKKKGFAVRPVISSYSGKTESKSVNSPTATSVATLSPPDQLGWVTLTNAGNNLSITFPGQPKIDQEVDVDKDKMMTMAYVIQPNTDNLFSLTYFTKDQWDSSSVKVFDKLVLDLKNSGAKVVTDKKSIYQGVPSLEIEIIQYGKHIRMKYFYLKEVIAEVAVTADKDEVRSTESEKFFNSMKIIK